MRRIRAIYAEVWDDETGQVAFAEVTPESRWPPPLVAEGGPADRQGALAPSTATPTAEAPMKAARGEEPEDEEAEQSIDEQSADEQSADEQAEQTAQEEPFALEQAAPPGGSQEDSELAPEELPTFEVDDRANSLKNLVWDEGVTEKSRKVRLAPWDGGMWMIFENDGEHIVLFRRGTAPPRSMGTPTSLSAAYKLALGKSREWMRSDEGDAALQAIARSLAVEWLTYVGTTVEIDGDRYHFRSGRVRRQMNTLVLCYVHSTKDKKHPRVEFRLTWTRTREGVWRQPRPV